MHHAFPHECPYPHIAEDASILAPTHWMDQKIVVSRTEREVLASAEAPEEHLTLDWSEEEVLAAHQISKISGRFNGPLVLRVLVKGSGGRSNENPIKT